MNPSRTERETKVRVFDDARPGQLRVYHLCSVELDLFDAAPQSVAVFLEEDR